MDEKAGATSSTNTDNTDAIGVIRNYELSINKSAVKSVALEIPVGHTDAECYNMKHPKRGTAVIFNHYNFDNGLGKRKGTMLDCEALNKVLKNLKFDVTTHTDLKYLEILDEIGSLAKADHSESDCLLIVVLSHGDQGVIKARDYTYQPDKLWKPFAGDKCITLAGKPKLFFIQACRGDKLDPGVTIPGPIENDASAANRTYTIPVMADILVMYSSCEGYYSFRNPKHGSWFIQILCDALTKQASNRDLMTILTCVNRTMAIDYQSFSSIDEAFHAKKQIGTIVSTLTRLVYLH